MPSGEVMYNVDLDEEKKLFVPAGEVVAFFITKGVMSSAAQPKCNEASDSTVNEAKYEGTLLIIKFCVASFR